MKKLFSILLALAMTASLTNCAHNVPQANNPAVVETNPDAPQVTLREVESFRVTDPEGPKVVDEELEQIPTEINPLVEKWIAYFQGKGRPHMERYLARSTRYMKLMKKILRQNGLPEDLVYIALIESGFSSHATSRAAAVGYWQFIKGTGKRYGMEINALVDERRDPVLATQAAAEYFKGLYSVFGSWYLAMASYNVGENRVKREVMNHLTRDFWELARKRRFPKETINYIPKFIAAKLIGNNPEKYGFTEIEWLTPIEFDHIKVDRSVNLKNMAAKMEIDYDDLKQLNPKFKGEIAPVKQGVGLELRVPIGATQTALVAAQASFVDKVEYIADAGETEMYKIRSGDSLSTIARKYHTTVAWLRDVNDMKNGRKLRVGQRIAVPDRSGRKNTTKYVAKAEKPEKQPEVEKESSEKAMVNPEIVTKKGVFYVVQAGDTLSAIADDYSSSVEELRRMNKMSRGSVLKAGMKLRVPKDEGLPADPSGAKATEQVADADKEDDSKAPVVAKSVKTDSDSAAATGSGGANSTEKVLVDSREPQSSGRDYPAHVVRPGDNLTTIAHKYGVSIQSIRKANNLKKRSVLKVGSRLVIPSEDRPQSRNNGNKSRHNIVVGPSKAEISMRKAHRPRIHIVRRGENLTQIAEKYNISLNALRGENRKIQGGKLFIGSKLLIPVANAAY
jgi:membrane-bound lytic murein transglycosylase D